MTTTIADLPTEDQVELKSALQAWKDAGTENPRIPLNVDLDGDGLADAVGLDDDGNLVVIPGMPIEETVFDTDAEGGE